MMNQRALSKATIKCLYEYDRQGICQGGYLPYCQEEVRRGSIVPAAASMQEVMASVRDDVLECLRTMYGTKEVVANKTLNSVLFKCL